MSSVLCSIKQVKRKMTLYICGVGKGIQSRINIKFLKPSRNAQAKKAAKVKEKYLVFVE